MTYKINDIYIDADTLSSAIKVYDTIFSDERLAPMTYKKLKEMGYTKARWKNLTQEQANKIVSQKQEYTEKKKEQEKRAGNTAQTKQVEYNVPKRKTYFENTINQNALNGHTATGKLYHSTRKTIGPKTKYSTNDIKDDAAYGGTLQQYVVNGELTDEREALHQEIIDDMLKDVKKAKKQQYVFLGGGPASGKSTFVNDFSKDDTFFHADADAVKERLPEYDAGYPSSVHEESSALIKRAKTTAVDEGYSVLDDSTGDGTVEKMKSRIKAIKEKGLKPTAIYITTDIPTAIERDLQRSRTVGKEEVVKIHKAVSDILPQIAADFEDVKLYRNFKDKNRKPILIATGGKGKGLTPVKGNEVYLREFLESKNKDY